MSERDVGPKCHCGHGMYEHYMCGGPESMKCYKSSSCGCQQFVDAVMYKRSRWEALASPEKTESDR